MMRSAFGLPLPRWGEGISCASSLLLMAIASRSQFSEQRINLPSHGFIHFDQRWPRPFESFTRELARGINSQLRSNCDFRGCVVEHVGRTFGEDAVALRVRIRTQPEQN